jgi:hypothetical protein
MFTITVDSNSLIEDGIQIQFPRNSYLKSYPDFVRYFNNIDVITEHNLVIGIHFVYGWMPTIFEFTSDNISSTLDLLNAAKLGYQVTNKELIMLKSVFNNSLVGTSKLLHFINPNLYAIWDSRVYRYLTGKESSHTRISKPESYLIYLDWTRNLMSDKKFPELKQHVEHRIGYMMSNYRIIELVAYSKGR